MNDKDVIAKGREMRKYEQALLDAEHAMDAAAEAYNANPCKETAAGKKSAYGDVIDADLALREAHERVWGKKLGGETRKED